IANGELTRPLPNIIGARLNSSLLPEPRTQARQENGIQESETMSVNRTLKNIENLSERARPPVGTPRHTPHIRPGIDEQRLQIAVRAVQAELASPLQALIVGAGVCDPIRRFRAFARRTGFQAGFVCH
ncbi:hypothetical protein ACPUER_36405, partial [Burkholderia sp. DN3021]|uniref:hypothetical protein n=1 Tax=Burkholderia sp. DN3021 TaxID=3410137 RepID=UPI003C7BB52D